MMPGAGRIPMEPPSPFRLASPQVLELRQGGGGAALFGVPFFLAGCAICFSLLRATAVGAPWGSGVSVLVFAGVGLAFAGIGTVLMFGRRWTAFDLSRGMLVRSYGLLVPLRTQEQRLSEFDAVVLAYDPGDSDRAECFPVRLRSLNGADFVVQSPGKFGDSRALTEYLADFLRFPLIDMISDHERVAALGRNQSLRERVVAGATEVTRPERPVNMRCTVIESGGTTTIVIPRGRRLLGHLLGIVLPLAVFLFVMPGVLRLLSRPETPPVARFGLVLLLTVLSVPPLIFLSVRLMVEGARKRTTLIASPAGLEIEQASGWRKHNKIIPADELLDVDSSTIDGAIQNVRAAANVPADTVSDSARWIQVLKKWVPSRGIVIKTRTELINFGEGLPAEELQYLRWVLRRALTP